MLVSRTFVLLLDLTATIPAALHVQPVVYFILQLTILLGVAAAKVSSERSTHFHLFCPPGGRADAPQCVRKSVQY
jgi:hypothetical protein